MADIEEFYIPDSSIRAGGGAIAAPPPYRDGRLWLSSSSSPPLRLPLSLPLSLLL